MLVKEHDFQIVAITINKKKAGRGLQSMKDEFYNHFCAVLAVEILKMNPSENDFVFVFDERSKSRDSNMEFESYIYGRIRHEFTEIGITPPPTLASRLDSQKSRGLQVVDFVVGAIHKKYESNESKFYDMISDSISREMRFFFWADVIKRRRADPGRGFFSHAPHGAFVPSGTYLPITFTAELRDIIF
jgi:hypothetical protein